MLEFVIFVLSGFGYALYYDLNLLETALVGVVVLCVYRSWTPKFTLLPAWRAWVKLAYRRKTAVAVVFFSALAIRAVASAAGSPSRGNRRVQPAIARRHPGARTVEQSDSSDVGTFREPPHHSKAHLQFRLFSRARSDSGAGNAGRSPMDCGVGAVRCNVRGAVLDAAGLGAAALGVVRSDVGRVAL
jgi:hypothetical protein